MGRRPDARERHEASGHRTLDLPVGAARLRVLAQRDLGRRPSDQPTSARVRALVQPLRRLGEGESVLPRDGGRLRVQGELLQRARPWGRCPRAALRGPGVHARRRFQPVRERDAPLRVLRRGLQRRRRLSRVQAGLDVLHPEDLRVRRVRLRVLDHKLAVRHILLRERRLRDARRPRGLPRHKDGAQRVFRPRGRRTLRSRAGGCSDGGLHQRRPGPHRLRLPPVHLQEESCRVRQGLRGVPLGVSGRAPHARPIQPGSLRQPVPHHRAGLPAHLLAPRELLVSAP